MKIDGGCHCGSIRFEAEVEPTHVVICHCTDCQTLTGSAFRTAVPTRPDTFRLLSGTPTLYVKTADSGRQRQQAFCPTCGTPIYSTSVGEGPKVHGLRVGTIRQRDQLVPKDQIWCRSAQPWLPSLPTMKTHEVEPVFTASGAAKKS